MQRDSVSTALLSRNSFSNARAINAGRREFPTISPVAAGDTHTETVNMPSPGFESDGSPIVADT